MADSHNKAIFIFTGVTIVFLPLSFFASYFDMNLDGNNALRSEMYFWQVCGPTAFAIIGLCLLLAFKKQIWVWFTRRRPNEYM